MRTRNHWPLVFLGFSLIAVLPIALVAETLTSHAQKSFPAAPGATVRVEASWQDVKVTVRPGGTVDVTVDMKVTASADNAKKMLDACAPRFKESGGDITVTTRPEESLSLFSFFGTTRSEGTVAVAVPPGVSLDLRCGSGDMEVHGGLAGGKVRLTTGSGDQLLEGAASAVEADAGSGKVTLKLGPSAASVVTVRTGSGDQVLEGGMRTLRASAGSGEVTVRPGPPAESVEVTTGSGDIHLSGGAARFEAHTGSGSVEAEDLSGDARIHTSSGDITAQWHQTPAVGEVSVRTSSGDVKLRLPAAAVLSGRIETSSGGIRSDFAGTSDRKERWEFSGQGGLRLDVETVSGDVTVHKSA